MRTRFNQLARKKYQEPLSVFSLGELQLLLQGLHVIGEQNRVDLQLLRSYRVLTGQIAMAFERQAGRVGAAPQETK